MKDLLALLRILDNPADQLVAPCWLPWKGSAPPPCADWRPNSVSPPTRTMRSLGSSTALAAPQRCQPPGGRARLKQDCLDSLSPAEQVDRLKTSAPWSSRLATTMPTLVLPTSINWRPAQPATRAGAGPHRVRPRPTLQIERPSGRLPRRRLADPLDDPLAKGLERAASISSTPPMATCSEMSLGDEAGLSEELR